MDCLCPPLSVPTGKCQAKVVRFRRYCIAFPSSLDMNFFDFFHDLAARVRPSFPCSNASS